MPVTDDFWNNDPSTLASVAVTSGLGDFSDELWYSVIEKSPTLHQLTGLPQDADIAFQLALSGKAAGVKMFDGGPAINERMVYRTGNSPLWVRGFDEYPYKASDEFRHFQYAPRWAVLPVGVSLDERRANAHRARPTDLIKEKVNIAMEVFAEDLGDKIINSEGEDFDGKVILGFKGIIRSDPSAAFTLGGWDISANANLRNKANADLPTAPPAGAAGDFQVFGRQFIRNQYNNVYKALRAKRTQLMLCSQNVFEAWMESLESRDVVIYQGPGAGRRGGTMGGQKVVEDGWEGIRYNQAIVIWDPKMPSGTVEAFNNMILFLTLGPVRLHIDREYWLRPTEWSKHKGQIVESMEILFSGNMTCGEPRALGIIDGFSGLN